jgi:hypothetical protein
MIRIKGYEKWVDFVFSIKGNLIKCVEASELDDWYFFRWEGISGWNYPMYEVSISRELYQVSRESQWEGGYYIQSKCKLTPTRNGNTAYTTLTKDELGDKDVVERKIMEVLENSCG